MQRKLSKRFFSAYSYGDVAERKGKGSQPTVVTFLPLLSTRRAAFQRRERAARSCTQNKRQAELYRSPKNTRRCAINRPRKATPFSKLWDCVIRSGEVAKNIAPNRFDNRKALTRSIYDCRGREFSLCRYISRALNAETPKSRFSPVAPTNAARNEFIESWFSFSWTFSRTSKWTLSPGTATACDCLELCHVWCRFRNFWTTAKVGPEKGSHSATRKPCRPLAEVELNFHN